MLANLMAVHSQKKSWLSRQYIVGLSRGMASFRRIFYAYDSYGYGQWFFYSRALGARSLQGCRAISSFIELVCCSALVHSCRLINRLFDSLKAKGTKPKSSLVACFDFRFWIPENINS